MSGATEFEGGFAAATKSIQSATNAHTLVALIVNSVGADRAVEAREAVSQLVKLV